MAGKQEIVYKRGPVAVREGRMAFRDVYGQERAVAVLKAARASGRLAGGYLFVGPPGVGKRFTALQFAKALNCLNEGEDACDECAHCRLVDREEFPDLLIPGKGDRKIVKGAAEGGQGFLAELLRRVHFAPVMGRWKVVLIDPADALTAEAGNMLLKTLEEPPPQTLFILTATVQHSVLPTLVSRCQCLRFTPLPAQTVARYLADHGVPPDVADAVARASRGSVEVALELRESRLMEQKQEILDYLLSLFDSSLSARVEDSARMLGKIAENERRAVERVSAMLAILCRDLLWASLAADAGELVFPDRDADLRALADRLGRRGILALSAIARDLAGGIGRNENPRNLLHFLGNRAAGLAAATRS